MNWYIQMVIGMMNVVSVTEIVVICVNFNVNEQNGVVNDSLLV